MIKDERTTQAMNQIYSELFRIVLCILAVSVMIKVLFLGEGLKDCQTEFIIMVFSPLYQLFRSKRLKVSFYPAKESTGHMVKTAFVSLAIGAGLLFVGNWVRSGSLELSSGLIGFIITYALVFLAVHLGVRRYERKRAEKLEEEYDEED